jgi:tetratricopeptide (TPR) repeat protein
MTNIQLRIIRRSLVLLQISILLLFPILVLSYEASPEDYLANGDDALSKGSYKDAIDFYQTGIDQLSEDESLLTMLSLETNLATAFSSMGKTSEAIDHYQSAISTYIKEIDDIADKEISQYAKEITSQSSFFLGMELQDEGQAEKSVEAYGYAVVLDPNHWSALANLGSVLHDTLKNHDEALAAYNKAYRILTSENSEPTDPPAEPRFILSQLQYRIGLCLNHNMERKCALADEPEKEVSCQEMATHAFSLAVQYDPENELAKHMLATVTADATMKRASNIYVKNLFDDYAQK